MAETTYSYSIADDFPATGLDPSRMVQDIQQSAIVTALERIDVAGDDCDIIFKDALSAGDKTLLDNDATGPSGGLIAAHTGVALIGAPQPFELFVGGEVAPATSDKKLVFTANAFPGTVVETVVGAGDHATNGIGAGQVFQLSESSAADEVVEFQFNDSVYLAAGGGMFKGALLGDYVNLLIYAPATGVTAADPANTGNCNLTAVGGGVNLITPAADNGTHDVDLDAACIVPSSDGTGYYDWDAPSTGKGTITAGTAGASLYNLFDSAINIAQFATKIPILGDDHIVLGIQNIKAKKLLPHWKGKCTLHNDAGTQEVSFVFYLKLGRAQTV